MNVNFKPYAESFKSSHFRFIRITPKYKHIDYFVNFECSISITGCAGSMNQPFSQSLNDFEYVSLFLVGFCLNTDSNDRANTTIISAMQTHSKLKDLQFQYCGRPKNQYSTLKCDSYLLMKLFFQCILKRNDDI